MGSCAAPSAKGDDKFITTDYLQQCHWDDITEAVPAFLTIVFMPFAYSIADGIAMGFISYALVKLFTGKAKTVPYMVWIIAALWVFKFIAFGG